MIGVMKQTAPVPGAGLLEFLDNPQAIKDRIVEFNQARDAANQAKAEADASIAEASKRHAELDAREQSLNGVAATHEATAKANQAAKEQNGREAEWVRQRKVDLQAWADALREREATLAKNEVSHTARLSALDSREQAIAKRENTRSKAEAEAIEAADSSRKEHEAATADIENRLAQVRAILNG